MSLTPNDLQQIKSIFDDSLESKLEEKIEPIKTDISELKTDVSGLKTDIGELKTDVNELKTDVGTLKIIVNDIRNLAELNRDLLVSLVPQFVDLRESHEVRIVRLEEIVFKSQQIVN